MNYKFVLFLSLLVLPLSVMAESKDVRATQRSELRLGWGDMISQTAYYHESMRRDYTLLPPVYSDYENRNYKYTGHLILEYQYRLTSWFGVGGKADASAFLWDRYYFHGGSNEVQNIEAHHCYNIALIPQIRFTWFHHEWADLYSSLGIGMIINGGTETNLKGQHVECGWAADAALVGFTVGRKHLFAGLEVGGMMGLKDLKHIYLLGSRFITISAGVRF